MVSGIRKFPNAPVSRGMITKKIITEACMREQHVVDVGRHVLAAVVGPEQLAHERDIAACGQPSWVRTSSASEPPITRKISPEIRN